jgi:NADH:ubiquinone oxidoreductase subunit 6 (subunit J)
VGAVSEASPNRDLFRIYAVACLIGSAFVVAVAYSLADVSDVAVTIYLAIGVALWAVDMAVTGMVRRRTGDAANWEHGLAHAVLVAAFALVWPLVLLAALGAVAFKALRE